MHSTSTAGAETHELGGGVGRMIIEYASDDLVLEFTFEIGFETDLHLLYR